MEVLTRVQTAGGQITFGVATTRAERAAILAQRFRVYQRRGYYRPGLTVDRDEYDRKAVYFLAALRGGEMADVMVGSARLMLREPDTSFRFLSQKSFQFALPEAVREIPVHQREEVSRLVSERPEGIVLGGLLTPLGLVQAISEYSLRHDIRCGLATIKQRLLRAFHGLGIRFNAIPSARLIYPRDGAVSAYFYRHSDPVIPVYWLADEIAPSIQRAIAHYQDRQSPALSRRAVSS